MKKKYTAWLYLPGIVAIMFSAACKKKNEAAKRIKEGTVVEIGAVLPEIRDTRNDTVMLALYPHARFFFIDLSLKNSDKYINLIKQANKKDIPLRVRVYEDNQSEVAELYPATAKDLENYNKSKIPTD
nr:hypothetical protein [Pedobacter panaciterrae]